MTEKELPRIQNPSFQDRNISPLESHPRRGKILKTPLSRLDGSLELSSWYDECIPNILWACIVATHVERTTYLRLFRRVVGVAREKLERRKQSYITHNFLSTLANEEFDQLLGPVLENKQAKASLAALRLIECLPDAGHWNRHLAEIQPDEAWPMLAKAVGETFDHQSEKTTDIRWFKLMYLIYARDGVTFDQKLASKLEEIRLFPDKGDMRSVRPSIRAMELAMRPIEFGDEKVDDPKDNPSLPPNHCDAFWLEMKSKTRCVPVGDFSDPQAGPRELIDEVLKIYDALDRHFHATTVTTAADPRHDGSFGLTLYALAVLLGSSLGYTHNLVEGRMALRTIMEAFVTLHYLLKKDSAGLWLQYRRYGTGQAKLAFLKNIREPVAPGFLDLHLLEHLANEDIWMEFQDINVGNWANTNLRVMAEDAGAKDAYDKYYDWASSYAHAHWACVRDTVFAYCLNPLHRFHRIPAPPKVNVPSILPDACRLVNRMLDDINQLYPTFKPRLKWHNVTQAAPVETTP